MPKYYDPQSFTYYEPAAGYTPPASHILQPETTTPTTTVQRPQGQGIEDFTRSLDTTSTTQSSQPNSLQGAIGTRPSPSNPNVTEYYDIATGKGFSSEGDVLKFAGEKTGKTFSDWGQFDAAYKLPGLPKTESGTEGGSGYQSPVGTSETERAKKKAEEIARIKAELEQGTEKPSPFKSMEEFDRLRKEQGVVQDEEELSSLRNEAALGKQELRQFKQTSSKGVSQGGYLGGVSEAETNLSFRMEGLAIREQAVLSRLNSKNQYISTALQLGISDYNTARQEYESSWNRNLQATELYNQDIDDQKKDALTSLTTLQNLLKDKNVDFSNLDSATLSQIETLALQAELPIEIVRQAFMSQPNAEIAHFQKNDDGTTSVFYKQNGKIVDVETYGTPSEPEVDIDFQTIEAPDGSKRTYRIDKNTGEILDEPLAEERIAGEEKALENTVSNLTEKLSTIKNIANDKALGSAVGPTKIWRWAADPLAGISGSRQAFIGKVQKLSSQETLDEVIALKKAAGGIGTLSDRDVQMLREASSAINAWAVRDENGNTTHYNVSEKAFRTELNKLYSATERLLNQASDLNKDEVQNMENLIKPSSSGMRTDRHLNPTAFTTDIAKLAGLKEGVDYTKGDPFSNGRYYTAKLIKDPLKTTIQVIDRIGFKTQAGANRWTYTDRIPETKNWNNLNYSQKKQVIAKMYQHEGGTKLRNLFA